MDAHLFRLFSERTAGYFNGAMIEKIREPRPGLLEIALYGQGGKKSFLFRHGKQNPFCFFSRQRLPVSGHPAAPIMRLRKYFGQGRIGASVFQFWQRKLWLMASTRGNETGKSVWLCLDLANGHSLHFLDNDHAPQPDSHVWPRPDNLEDALENWQAFPMLTPALRRTLKTLDQPERMALLCDLEAGGGDLFIYRKGLNGEISAVSAWPLQAKPGETEETMEDILAGFELAGNELALAPIYQKQGLQIVDQAKRKSRQLEKLLDNLKKDEQKLLAMSSRGSLAESLRNSLWALDKDAHAAEVALPDGSVVPLDDRYSVLENMERMFRASTRGKRGMKILQERRQLLQKELEEYRAGIAEHGQRESGANAVGVKALSRHAPGNVAVFRSSDGFVMLRGKDARGNMAARKMAQPYDLWAHVEKGQGAHVIIRKSWPGQEVPERTLREAGSLAALRSWLKDAGQASVMFAEARHVKPLRKGGAGNVSIDRIACVRLVNIWQEAERKLAGNQDATGEGMKDEE